MGRNIVLIGMPGSGKSTIGKRLAERLGMEFCDIDEYIEKKEGRTISDIFKYGEAHFREIEKKAVREVSKMQPLVIATGGGIVLKDCNIRALKENGVIIFIDRNLDDILSDVDVSRRPLLKNGKDQLCSLYEDRIELYKKYCDIQILNDKGIDQVIDDIIEAIGMENTDLHGEVIISKQT
ncbi:shikimate kinase [Lutispora saccharofermentans]|uniref:Shikimate kinase n=1 Tax=Lutispora saccharofermentans TaxID=3024236 RepID=A0ABT1NJ88_9FIRM|nr:shikimate kinase [Lutispora saccharofermentans]MCQ1531299.1 shikimate kinase [Lutispora saccharofermentans]